MKDDNRFIAEDPQEQNTSPGMDEEYNSQESSDFIYIDNNDGNAQQPSTSKFNIMEKLNTKTLIIIGLVFLFLIFAIILFINIGKKAKYNDWLDKIKIAAKEHVSDDDDVRAAIEDGDKDKVYFFELLDGNHLKSSDLTNPNTKKQVSKCNYVIVSIDPNTIITYDEVVINEKTCPKQKPKIKLIGDTEITVVQGDKYEDAGAEAYDFDGVDLTEKIKLSMEFIPKDATEAKKDIKELDTNQLGTYTLKYSVKNKSGNKSNIVARTVVIEAGAVEPVVTPPATPQTPQAPYVDRTKPVITSTGLPQTIKVGQTASFSITFSDNVKVKAITYCNPGCTNETVNAKSRIKYLNYVGTAAGTISIEASAKDSSGNMAYFAKTITVINDVDTLKPTVEWLNPISTVAAGTTIEVKIRFNDNVAINRYSVCLGVYCDTRSVAPSKTVIVPIKATLNIKGNYIITGSATDTSGNYSNNLHLGTITVN